MNCTLSVMRYLQRQHTQPKWTRTHDRHGWMEIYPFRDIGRTQFAPHHDDDDGASIPLHSLIWRDRQKTKHSSTSGGGWRKKGRDEQQNKAILTSLPFFFFQLQAFWPSFTPAPAQTDHPRRERSDDGTGWHWIPWSSRGTVGMCAPERLGGGQKSIVLVHPCTAVASGSRFGLVPLTTLSLITHQCCFSCKTRGQKKRQSLTAHTLEETPLPTSTHPFFHGLPLFFSISTLLIDKDYRVIVIGLAANCIGVSVFSLCCYVTA